MTRTMKHELQHSCLGTQPRPLPKPTVELKEVWDKKVLDKDVVSTVYTAFQKDHKLVCNSLDGAAGLLNGAEFCTC